MKKIATSENYSSIYVLNIYSKYGTQVLLVSFAPSIIYMYALWDCLPLLFVYVYIKQEAIQSFALKKLKLKLK